MPSHVRNFLGFSLLGLAISLVSVVFTFDESVARIPSPNASTIIIITDVIMFGISIGLIAATAWGRQNWARWVMLIFFLIGLASFVMLAVNPAAAAQMSSFQLGAAIVSTILQGAALFMIFTGDAKDWFKRADKRA